MARTKVTLIEIWTLRVFSLTNVWYFLIRKSFVHENMPNNVNTSGEKKIVLFKFRWKTFRTTHFYSVGEPVAQKKPYRWLWGSMCDYQNNLDFYSTITDFDIFKNVKILETKTCSVQISLKILLGRTIYAASEPVARNWPYHWLWGLISDFQIILIFLKSSKIQKFFGSQKSTIRANSMVILELLVHPQH